MSIAHDIGHTGMFIIGSLGAGIAAEIRGHLGKYPQRGGQIAASRGVVKPENLAEHAITSYPFDATLTAPYVFDIAFQLEGVAREYLAPYEPHIYSVNAFWSRPHGKDAKTYGIQSRHKDFDDDRFLPLFIYLTDVLSEADGPFTIETARGNKIVLGEAGTAFFADTKRMHRGLPAQTKPRLMMWIRWGVSERPKVYANDELKPISSTLAPPWFQDHHKRATRLLFDWDKSE